MNDTLRLTVRGFRRGFRDAPVNADAGENRHFARGYQAGLLVRDNLIVYGAFCAMVALGYYYGWRDRGRAR